MPLSVVKETFLQCSICACIRVHWESSWVHLLTHRHVACSPDEANQARPNTEHHSICRPSGHVIIGLANRAQRTCSTLVRFLCTWVWVTVASCALRRKGKTKYTILWLLYTPSHFCAPQAKATPGGGSAKKAGWKRNVTEGERRMGERSERWRKEEVPSPLQELY